MGRAAALLSTLDAKVPVTKVGRPPSSHLSIARLESPPSTSCLLLAQNRRFQAAVSCSLCALPQRRHRPHASQRLPPASPPMLPRRRSGAAVGLRPSPLHHHSSTSLTLCYRHLCNHHLTLASIGVPSIRCAVHSALCARCKLTRTQERKVYCLSVCAAAAATATAPLRHSVSARTAAATATAPPRHSDCDSAAASPSRFCCTRTKSQRRLLFGLSSGSSSASPA